MITGRSFILYSSIVLRERSKAIMMNDRGAVKRGGHTINDYR